MERAFQDGLQRLQAAIGVTLGDQALLRRAMTHKSYINETADSCGHNERVEFLGDAVLELCISEGLYERFPEMSEGQLSRARSALVRSETLAGIATRLGLGELLRLGHGEVVTGGRTKASVLADAFEALLGAVFLDQGIDRARQFVKDLMWGLLAIPGADLSKPDPRSMLQERVQAGGKSLPGYTLLEAPGEGEARSFVVAVSIDGLQVAVGRGRSKKEAARRAAALALETLVAAEPARPPSPLDKLGALPPGGGRREG